MLVDAFGRVARDLRVSLTDRCSLRCTYCMPEQGLSWLPGADVLTDDEVIRLVRLAVTELGVDEVRFTGGEPLLRKGLEAIVAATPAPTSVTTNGLGLATRAVALRDAGLSRVNVSVDTLDPETFRTLSRRDRLAEVLAGLDAAVAAGLTPVKVNAVLLRGVNDHEAADLLAYCLDRGYELRFIEQMPLDPMHAFDRASLVTAEEVLARLSERFSLTPLPGRGSAPAERWSVAGDGVTGTVGIIGSVTRPFCGDCDRTRLTADGQVRSCLFAREESDLRGPMRAGATDAELADRWRAAMAGKAAGHGIDDPSFLQPQRPMSAIGG